MDSLLSKAQRCGRLADQLAKYGMYDEGLEQLEKSMDFLKQLKLNLTTNTNLSNINVEIEQIDRKMRRFSIKRIEDAKKKTQLENALKNKEIDAPVLIQTTNNGTNMQGYQKLDKDDKSVIEELTTINSEYRKVNLYLSNEIDHLKKENAYLKQELLKYIKSCEDNMSTVEATSSCVSNTSNSKLLNTNSTNSSKASNLAAININKSDEEDDVEQDDEKQQDYKTVDLTKYINSDESDSDDSCHNNMPPLEFTIDS